jgi:phage tail tape-measure protein
MPENPGESSYDQSAAIEAWENEGGAPAPSANTSNFESPAATAAEEGASGGILSDIGEALGAFGLGLQAGLDLETIANAPPAEQEAVAAEKAGAWSGAITGAEVGAEIGILAGGPIGSAIGAAIGWGIGYWAGENTVKQAINDSISNPSSNPSSSSSGSNLK